MKALDALKAAAFIFILLFFCIAALWIISHLLHPEQPQPELTPRPAGAMWEESPTTR